MSIFNILSFLCKNCARRWRPSRTIPADRTSVVLPPRLYVHTCDLRERWLRLRSKIRASLAAMTSASMATTLDGATVALTNPAVARTFDLPPGGLLPPGSIIHVDRMPGPEYQIQYFNPTELCRLDPDERVLHVYADELPEFDLVRVHKGDGWAEVIINAVTPEKLYDTDAPGG